MIALNDDLNQHSVDTQKSTLRTRSKMRTLLQKLIGNRDIRKQRKAEKLAINQLIQLDDALLKDIGITRRQVHEVRRGALSIDALIKSDITAKRDNASNTQSPQAKHP